MTALPASKIAARLAAVRDSIAEAARAAGRDPSSVELVAVSKTHEPAAVEEALVTGQRIFGENRVQEAEGKFPSLRARWPDLALHLIGPLQTNKVKEAVALFDVIETVDRPKLARMLAEEMHRTGRLLPCYIQVNIGNEPQKAGVGVDNLGALIALARDECRLPVVGLMCIPPAEDDPRGHFECLAALGRAHNLSILSMGMSGDFREAIAAGATHVRVGTAIFGTRD